MNALLINPIFPTSFWTLKEVNIMSGSKTLGPPLGLITVAAMLPEHWQLRLVDLNTKPVREEDWQWADVVLLTGMLFQKYSVLRLIREAKTRSKITVAGGPYATSFPESVREAGCDFIVRGEAECLVFSLVEAMETGEREGVLGGRKRPDLGDSPIPRFDLLDLESYAVMSVQTSRGCPFDCEFCDIASLYGRKQRYKTPEQVVAELEAIYRLGWRSEIFICDDNFIGNKANARAILDQMILWMESRRYPFSFVTQVSMNLGQDHALMALMTKANVSVVFVGVESPDEDILAASRKYQNVRDPLAESLNNMKGNGLTVVGSFVIGFDGERSGAGERICRLVEECAIPPVQLNTLYALPATRLSERLEKEGRLRDSTECDLSFEESVNFLPTRPKSQIIEEFAAAWVYLYEPSRFLGRTYRYYLSMRPTRPALQQGNHRPDSGVEAAGSTLRRKFYDVLGLFRLFWWQGIKSKSRGQFWRQLIEIRRTNPSRLIRYLKTCAFGECLIRMAPQIGRQAAEYLSKRNEP